MGIGIISTFPPRRCGIASFARQLREALLAAGVQYVPVVAVGNRSGENAGDQVLARLRPAHLGDYLAAASVLNRSPVEAVFLQHEFSIFGRQGHSCLPALLSALRKPVITLFHTVPERRTARVRPLIEAVAAGSTLCAALSHRDRSLLCTRYGISPERTLWLPLGTPMPPAESPAAWKERLGLQGRTVAMTFGLLTPSKGIETALRALARVVRRHRELLYVLAGIAHPEAGGRRNRTYYRSLCHLVRRLRLQDHVRFEDRFLDEEELLGYLQASDLYVTPYRDRDRGSSGTLTIAASLGKPILSTPFAYARELLDGGAGYLFPFRDVSALASGMEALLADPVARERVGEAARERTSELVWPRAVERYLAAARQAAQLMGTSGDATR